MQTLVVERLDGNAPAHQVEEAVAFEPQLADTLLGQIMQVILPVALLRQYGKPQSF